MFTEEIQTVYLFVLDKVMKAYNKKKHENLKKNL